MREKPKHLNDFTFDNQFSILSVDMRLVDNIEKGLVQIRNDLAYLKTSPMPFGYYYLTQLVMRSPHFIANMLIEDLGHKLTMGFSNVPGPKKPLVLAGKECTAMAFNIPLGKTVALGFGAISHYDNIKLTIGADKGCVKDTDVLMEFVSKNWDEMLGSTEWRKFHSTGTKTQ
jgi:diacylglycerol O-acyltransferase / wax synthase